ncbi:Serine carboxypeptidase-like 12 [Morus notabilis]|uniref:Serine carboxypeptidase-like 12 n=1 Tax=Morus notabilis TaxID=981085 RepID=W9S638_9ROSA|nr:Serine carboxypeptidase-like 12 [Morus notabilis]
MASRHLAKVLKCICIPLIICLMLFSDSVVPSSVVKSLPGFPGSLPFNLETGYIAVDEKEDVQFFYYFVESEGNPRDDSLMLWFVGGPGCSGLSGLAFEIGPFRFNYVEYNGSLPTLELNPNSWTKVASIIFIDAPAGSGFSYSKSWEGSQTGDLWLLAHPKFISNPLYVGGDSYGGFIVPIVAEEIAKSVKASHTPEFNFQGYLVGNPNADRDINWNSRVQFARRMAIISDELYESVKKNCKGQYKEDDTNTTPCAIDLNAISLMEFFKWKSLLEQPSDPKSGDHDMAIPYIGTQAWIKSLNIPIVSQWRPWMVDDQIAGVLDIQPQSTGLRNVLLCSKDGSLNSHFD